MMPKPVWYDYLVWDFSDPSFPETVGFQEGTPQEILDKYEEDRKRFEKMQEENPDACIF